MKEINAARIRAQFSNPVSLAECPDHDEGYCVGGALLKYIDESSQNFPVGDELAATFLQLNPRVTPKDALICAEDIISANDVGDFSLAWNLLDDVLSWEF